MRPKKLALKTAHEHKGKRLDQVLAEWLPQVLSQSVSKGKARKLVVAGAVYLNGKRVRIASKELQANATIEVYVDLEKLNSDSASRDKVFVMGDEHVLYEDDALIAVNKPAGLPTQPTVDEARDNLFAAVKKYLAKREPNAYVGLHHRLDRDTSGVVLFTKKVEANAGVGELFASHFAVKTYNALCARPSKLPGQTWTVQNFLARGKEKKSKMQPVRSGGDFAHTDFHLIEIMPGGLWVEAKPKTGRMHQIRVHLSEAGMPILGDATYGRGDTAERLMLHAASLTFPHPLTKIQVSIQSPLPEDFVKCLARARK